MQNPFEGYSFLKWFAKNKAFFFKEKDTIKTVVSAAAAIVAATYGGNPVIALLFGAGTGYGTRFVLDLIDYALTADPK